MPIPIILQLNDPLCIDNQLECTNKLCHTALVLTVNGQIDGAVVNFIIGLSIVVDANIRTVLKGYALACPNWLHQVQYDQVCWYILIDYQYREGHSVG